MTGLKVLTIQKSTLGSFHVLLHVLLGPNGPQYFIVIVFPNDSIIWGVLLLADLETLLFSVASS